MPEETPPTGETPRPPVVKKVVKKAVVRPAPSGRSSTTTAPPRPRATAVSRVTKPVKQPTPAQPAKPARSVDLGAGFSRVGGAIRSGAQRAWHGALDAGWAVRDRSADGVDAVLDYRLPQQPPTRAAVIAGAVAGLVAAGLGALAGVIFTQLRGTTSGGGFWGSIAFVAVMVLVVVLGARLAALLGCPSGLVVSFLGTVFAIVVILMFFLNLSQGAWAFLLVPALGAVGFGIGERLVDLAERPVEQ